MSIECRSRRQGRSPYDSSKHAWDEEIAAPPAEEKAVKRKRMASAAFPNIVLPRLRSDNIVNGLEHIVLEGTRLQNFGLQNRMPFLSFTPIRYKKNSDSDTFTTFRSTWSILFSLFPTPNHSFLVHFGIHGRRIQSCHSYELTLKDQSGNLMLSLSKLLALGRS